MPTEAQDEAIASISQPSLPIANATFDMPLGTPRTCPQLPYNALTTSPTQFRHELTEPSLIEVYKSIRLAAIRRRSMPSNQLVLCHGDQDKRWGARRGTAIYINSIVPMMNNTSTPKFILQPTWNSEFETIHLYCTSDYDRSSTMINGNVILSDNDLQRIRYTFLLSRPSMNSPARDLEDEDESNRPSIDDISPKEEQAKSNQAFTGIPQ